MGYKDFELDLEKSLLAQLPTFLDSIDPTRLDESSLDAIESEAQGAYLLFHEGDLVYVGKSDSEAGLKKRLYRHFQHVQFRIGLNPRNVSFKAARIYSFSVMDVERLLIKHYRDHGKLATWNDSGFGSNDPGRKRDSQEPSDFDKDFPIDITRSLGLTEGELSGEVPVYTFLSRLKNRVPFLIRFDTRHLEIRTAVFSPKDVLKVDSSLERALTEVVNALPFGWQATVLPGYCIVYRENKEYDGARLIVRRQTASAV